MIKMMDRKKLGVKAKRYAKAVFNAIYPPEKRKKLKKGRVSILKYMERVLAAGYSNGFDAGIVDAKRQVEEEMKGITFKTICPPGPHSKRRKK